MRTALESRFRGGLGLAGTLIGSAAAAWLLAALVMEAVTVPDLAGVALVSALSGLALVTFAFALLPLGMSLRLLGGWTPLIVSVAPISHATWLGGRYRADCDAV